MTILLVDLGAEYRLNDLHYKKNVLHILCDMVSMFLKKIRVCE